MTNLTINVAGGSGCQANTEFWAASQAAPLRRVIVNGNVSLMDYCDGSPDYASGGFIADSRFTGGTVINGSQQQYITRDTDLDGWTNGVWNQVFCGDPGAPAQSFAANSGDPGGPAPYTTLATCPVTQGSPVPLPRRLRPVPGLRALAPKELERTELGRGRHPRHLAAAEQVLRRQPGQHRRADQHWRCCSATTSCSPRASTTSRGRSTSCGRTRRSSASASPPWSRPTATSRWTSRTPAASRCPA